MSSLKSHETFMRRAIELSKYAGIKEKTGGAFGAIIVKNNNIISEGCNQVIKHNDPTWHAEIQAIREACNVLKSPHINGCILYTSAEPCPMCLSAAYWAHIDFIYYASRIEDALQYGKFIDVAIYSEIRKENHERKIQMSEILRNEAVEVWKEFEDLPDQAKY